MSPSTQTYRKDDSSSPPPAPPESSPQPPRRRTSSGASVFSWFSVSNIAIAIFLAYIGVVATNLHRIMNPVAYLPPTTEDSATLDPLWPQNMSIDIHCYLSHAARANPFTQPPVWTAKGLSYSWETPKPEATIKFVQTEKIDHYSSVNAPTNNSDGSSSTTTNTESPPPIQEDVVLLPRTTWTRLRQGKEVYLHVFITASGASPDPASPTFKEPYTVHQAVPLVKKHERKIGKPKRFLLNGTSIPLPDIIQDDYGLAYYWIPEVAIRVVTDFTKYPDDAVPLPIWRKLRLHQSRNQIFYLPPLHVDDIGLTSDKLVGLNSSLTHLPLKLSFSPMSLQRWQLMQVLEQSLEQQRGLGFEQSDIDDVRRLIADTNVLLLAVTVFASTLHLLFEFLAFHSDISFWRKNKSLRGLSVRSVVVEFVFQFIILLFLIDTDSSLLLTVPSAIGLMIQAWKVHRATGATFIREPDARLGFRLALTRLEASKEEGEKGKDDDKAALSNSSNSSSTGTGEVVDTMVLDRIAVTHLSLALFPLTIGFALRSLLMEEHSGWYSWSISSLVGCVYTFGFILMAPQLFINYKLRSVAHLPWRFLCYRFLNTFIDDLFAFIIRMPTMHRISCFRDDVVFIIYLYQRYMYPVDSSRKMDDEDCAGS